MKVFELNEKEIQYLHDATEHSYFKDDGEGNFVNGSIAGVWFGVEKFIKRFPDVDVSMLKQIEYVQKEEII